MTTKALVSAGNPDQLSCGDVLPPANALVADADHLAPPAGRLGQRLHRKIKEALMIEVLRRAAGRIEQREPFVPALAGRGAKRVIAARE